MRDVHTRPPGSRWRVIRAPDSTRAIFGRCGYCDYLDDGVHCGTAAAASPANIATVAIEAYKSIRAKNASRNDEM